MSGDLALTVKARAMFGKRLKEADYDALMQKIDEGERFGKGDAIKVKLRRVQRYNKEYRAYENKSYRIVEFIEHIIPQKPLNLFEEK